VAVATGDGVDSAGGRWVAYPARMAQVRLFASMREAAGRSHDEVPGATVGEVLDGAIARYGTDFEQLLARCRVWVNGEQVPPDSPVTDDDEVAVLPPVSGG